MPRGSCFPLGVLILCLAAAAAGAGPLGGAFLDTGLGARALGLGGAQAAASEGPAAVLYNPAGLATSTGKGVLASYQPMSLDRTRSGLAAAMNPRGGLAFGLAWLHAGVGGLQARSGSGEVIAGDLDNAEDAVIFGLGLRPLAPLQLGGSLKILRHRIEVPGSGTSTASGRGVDLGLRWRLSSRTALGATARNLLDKLSWTVKQPSDQTSVSEEALRSALLVGVSHTFRPGSTAAVDAEILDPAGGRELRGHLGLEWRVSDLLTLRGGLHRAGEGGGLGQPAFGATVRPMRIEAFQVHYAYVADEIGAGARTVLTLVGQLP